MFSTKSYLLTAIASEPSGRPLIWSLSNLLRLLNTESAVQVMLFISKLLLLSNNVNMFHVSYFFNPWWDPTILHVTLSDKTEFLAGSIMGFNFKLLITQMIVQWSSGNMSYSLLVCNHLFDVYFILSKWNIKLVLNNHNLVKCYLHHTILSSYMV